MKLYLRYMKEYKKNTVTVFLCFLLTVVLISGLLILMHTNHRVEALQNMLTHTPADVRITSLTENQVEILRNDSDISKMAIFEKPEYSRSASSRRMATTGVHTLPVCSATSRTAWESRYNL